MWRVVLRCASEYVEKGGMRDGRERERKKSPKKKSKKRNLENSFLNEKRDLANSGFWDEYCLKRKKYAKTKI